MKRSSKIIFSSITSLLVLVLFSGLAFAQGADAAATEAMKAQGLASNYGLIALAAGLGIGIAALGGGIGQGRAAAAALDGIARNPGAAGQIRGPMILGLALIESLVIYALIISLLLVLKVGA
jgi:F-type H+-transporting ATPase subunit c